MLWALRPQQIQYNLDWLPVSDSNGGNYGVKVRCVTASPTGNIGTAGVYTFGAIYAHTSSALL